MDIRYLCQQGIGRRLANTRNADKQLSLLSELWRIVDVGLDLTLDRLYLLLRQVYP